MKPDTTHEIYQPDQRAARTILARGTRPPSRAAPPRLPREAPIRHQNSVIAVLVRKFREAQNQAPAPQGKMITMATTKHTYPLCCPECENDFSHECDPITDLADQGDLIECPICGEFCEWNYDDTTNTLTLLAECADEEDDEDDEDDDDDEDDEEDDDEEDDEDAL